jgi:hypothetical protein
MPLDFPTSPTNGQAYNGYVYSTAVGAWQAKPSAQSPFYTGDTPPGNPVVGDSWFNTNDGTMYVYYNDGNTSQWVEHRSEIARSQVGLVPLRPTSVTVGSGTASVDVNGFVNFSGANNLFIDGVFTSAYRNYKIVMSGITASNAAYLLAQFRGGGSTKTGSHYFSAAAYQLASGASGVYGGFNGITYTELGMSTVEAGWAHIVWDVFMPAIPSSQTSSVFASTGYAVAIQNRNGACMYNLSEALDGFRFYPNVSSNLGGQIKIYGYN